MMRHDIFAGLLAICLFGMVVPALAEVSCTNQNTAMNETTATADFTDNGDGTVTHDKTGLTWARCLLGQSWDGSTCTGSAGAYRWPEALQAVIDLNDGGGYAAQTDWRLPNRSELESIVERRCWSPAINSAIFPATPSLPQWSSSPDASSASGAWAVYISTTGDILSVTKTGFGRARLVRAGR